MQHDGGSVSPAPAETVAMWPKGSFAENLAVAPDGAVYVTLHTDRAVVRFDPASGAVTPFATFPLPVAGLAFDRGGSLIVSGGVPGQLGGVIWRVTGDGVVSHLVDVADAAFLNGVTPHPDGRHMLVAESLGGRIYLVDPVDAAVAPWLVDRRLAPSGPGGSPGANGIKVYGNAITISMTADDMLFRAPIDGDRPGPLEPLAGNLRADDFAFGADGSMFIATHPAHSLVRLGPDGVRSTLATVAHGMTGATAVAFGRGPADRTAVYVTATGGTMILPEPDLEPAKLVRIEVGTIGAPIPGSV